jgi:hypothetical protein
LNPEPGVACRRLPGWIPVDDLVGTLTYRGPRETIGVGRGCSFGSGRYSLTLLPA